jgi:outer membrane receptor protein involved in Fe transport
MDDFKLRGSFDHAVRAPNVVELYSQQAVGLFDWGGDPCAGDVPDATLAECQLTGMTPAQYGNTPLSPAQQYNQLAGGNPDLNPETADTWTAGIVLTPTFLDGFTMTIDYFNIKITDVINNIQAPTTVSQCIATADPFFCDNIHRNDSGSLWLTRDGYVNAITTNLGSYKTTGTDFNVNYNLAMGDWGSLNFNELATWLDSFVVEEIPGYGKYDCKGYYGATCGTPLPEWKSKFRTTWSTPWNVDLAVTWRYVASVENDAFNSDIGGALKPFDKTLDSQNYWDLAGTFSFAEHYTLNAGINNILDESPPLSSQVGTGYGNGNTYPQVYDALGRYIFVGLTAKF